MKKLSIFYDPRMSALDNQPSPSARKPKLVIEQWQERNYPIEIESVLPLARSDFYNSHEKSHVDDILDLKKKNGMETISRELSESLYWTSGSLLSAARHALNHKIAVSPTSGFHHAEYAASMGFCTFNGLMITAQTLLRAGLVKKVGIFDCDQHFGNGTEDIIEHFALADKITHITSEQDYNPRLRSAGEFFIQLPLFLQNFADCDILIYQAGADCHIDDPHGGFLTSEEMRVRDAKVFDFCSKLHIPLVWNLAGGYQEERLPSGELSIQKVLDLHNTTLLECAKVYLR